MSAQPPREKRSPPAKSAEDELRAAAELLRAAGIQVALPGEDGEAEVVDAEPVVNRAQSEAAALGGRVSFKLTEERYDRIIELVRVGNYLRTAAAVTGISERALTRYLQRGREVEARIADVLGQDHDLDDGTAVIPVELEHLELHANDWRCWRLMRAVLKAEAEAEAFAVTTVRKHMGDNWTAAMTYLERKAPERWRRRNELNIKAGEDATQLDDGDDRGLLDEAASQHVHDALKVAAERGLPEGDAA